MCIANESLGRHHRALRVLANLALVAGLLLWNFAPKTVLAAHPWLDGIVGLCMGISIGMNLMLVLRLRRNRLASNL